MQSADRIKAGERSIAIVFLTLGIVSIESALVTDLLGKIVSILVGIGFILFVILGLQKRIIAFADRIGGSIFVGFLAIFNPLGGSIIFGFYAIVGGIAVYLGGRFGTDTTIIIVVSALVALANLVVLLLNIATLLRLRKKTV